ncbi:MAG: DUF1003 domain-containing protein [Porticoccaceae bacterium]
MSVDPDRMVRRLLGDQWQSLSSQEREIVTRIAHRVRNPEQEFHDRRTFGERASDAIAAFGGSWPFILIFLALLVIWAVLNTEILGPLRAFDPYPFIFLNLLLSMLAAIQAPIIMMSQNRAAERDRLAAEVDHEVNVRAELAVRDIDRRLRHLESHLDAMAERGPAQTSSAGAMPT